MGSASLEEIYRIAEKMIQTEGMDLVDIEFKTGRARNLLRIFIDKVGGVTLDDCENISRQLSAILDVKDLVMGSYVLEVSSPGVDRPFRTDRDYQRSLGGMVRIYFQNEKDQSETILGRLLEVTDHEVVVEQDGETKRIDRDRVKKAHQEIVLGHPKKNIARRK